jgi:uncharacterized protein
MYEERTYRQLSRPRDLHCYEVVCKETDVLCCTSVDLRKVIENRVLFYRHQLESYGAAKPQFLKSLVPVETDPLAPRIVQEMIAASTAVGVGPMACVAGGLAEFVGKDINHLSDEYIIENGGDIYLRTRKVRRTAVYAKDSPYSQRIGIALRPSDNAYGICTSSATVGPSLSLGKADAVCIVAQSALFADALATRLGNAVSDTDDLNRALEDGQQFPDVIGILIIMGKNLAVWGNIDLIEV